LLCGGKFAEAAKAKPATPLRRQAPQCIHKGGGVAVIGAQHGRNAAAMAARLGLAAAFAIRAGTVRG
jgi:hypothetical protein